MIPSSGPQSRLLLCASWVLVPCVVPVAMDSSRSLIFFCSAIFSLSALLRSSMRSLNDWSVVRALALLPMGAWITGGMLQWWLFCVGGVTAKALIAWAMVEISFCISSMHSALSWFNRILLPLCIDGDLELHEGGSKVVVVLITDLHWFVNVPMATSLQDCQGRVGACCLVRGLNHWPNLSAFLLLPPRWSADVAPSIHGWPHVLCLLRQFPLLWLPLNPCLEQ